MEASLETLQRERINIDERHIVAMWKPVTAQQFQRDCRLARASLCHHDDRRAAASERGGMEHSGGGIGFETSRHNVPLQLGHCSLDIGKLSDIHAVACCDPTLILWTLAQNAIVQQIGLATTQRFRVTTSNARSSSPR